MQKIFLLHFPEGLHGHAVETLAGPFGAGERHIHDCSCDAAGAVIERMDVGFELFSLDLARFDHVLGRRAQVRFAAQVKSL